VHHISPDSFLNKELRNLNNGNHVLNLLTGTRLYLGSRLYYRDRKIRSCTSFFRPDGTLFTDGFIREKVKPIPIKKIT
jgi:hypothetical protein